jgi:BirA family biotin operon repressor/biotin-[acetyl-CoA-carboxylase] ligase
MQMRRKLLNILSDGMYHSGEALGSSLAISRMSVWKHIRALRECGIPLEVVKGKGYRLPGPVELLDSQAILAALRPETRVRLSTLETLIEIDSTNNHLRQRALEGAPSGTVCLAEMQHAGRGRNNRHWVSPFAANLYLSLLWRSATAATELGGLSLAAGVAIVRSLESFGIDCAGLKWPNDVVVDGAKLAGILIDVLGESGGPCTVVIGIGINVAMPVTAGVQIDRQWTDLCRLTGRRSFPRNQLAARILDSTMTAMGEFESAALQPFLDEWRRLDVVHGCLVDLHLPNEVIHGKACGVDPGGALLIETSKGPRRFACGEVSLRVAS